jgi:hypothetical protein
MCTAHIVAPQPVAHAIPFAMLVGAQPTPVSPAEVPPIQNKIKSESSASKVVLVDGGIGPSRMEMKDPVAALKMIMFAILTLGACLVAALLLMRS